MTGFAVINSQTLMKWRNWPNSNSRNLILILVSKKWHHGQNLLVGRGKMLWHKSRHLWIICSSHQILLHLVNSLLPFYVQFNSITISLYIMVIKYHIHTFVCSWGLAVNHLQLHTHLPKDYFYYLESLHAYESHADNTQLTPPLHPPHFQYLLTHFHYIIMCKI